MAELSVVLAPNAFKGSLTAAEAAEAMAAGTAAVFPAAVLHRVPLGDGGDGTATALVHATGGQLREVTVTGPLGRPVAATYAILGDGVTGAVEMASASGLVLVPAAQRDPLHATTYGTGELIRAALDAGCRRLVVCIGGSATNDGGAGMAAALGARLLRADGSPISPGGAGLVELDRIDLDGLDPRLAEVSIRVACDVDNPLLGPRGAAAVYGPQKGATPETVPVLDRALGRLAAVSGRSDLAEKPGAGAAGGLGFGLMAFLGARLEPGADLVMDAAGIDGPLAGAALVLTGEGRVDGQTLAGKVPLAVARRAARHGVPAVVICGSLGDGAGALLAHNVAALLSMTPGPLPLAEAMRRGPELLAHATATVMRLIRLGAAVLARE